MSIAAGRPTVFVLSENDPVAAAAHRRWGTPAATGAHVDGTPLRALAPDELVLVRPGWHVRDERLDERLPAELRAARPTLVFPSVHRSDSGLRCLTVHPLGNPGPTAEVGGRPRTLSPTDPRGMTAVLRELAERSPALGLTATFEATHHGPELGLPAFFAEIAVPEGGTPAEEEVRLLEEGLRAAQPEPADRVAVGAGGGHYAPHFTDLARQRRWAFGHLLSRHAVEGLDRATAEAAVRGTEGAEGILFARAQDRDHPVFAGVAPALRENAAERRPRASP